MGSTRRRCARLSRILDDSRLTEAAQQYLAFSLGWPPTAADDAVRTSRHEYRMTAEMAATPRARVRDD